jgi:competence protein ComEC
VVFWLCLSIVIGVALARGGILIDSSWWWLAAAGVLWTIKKQNIWCMLFIVALGLSLGWWRGSLYMTKLHDFQKIAGQKVTLVGQASGDAVYGYNEQLTFDVVNPTVESTGQHLTGKLSVSGFGVNAVYDGDVVRVHATLRLARGSYQARMSYAQLEIIEQHPSHVADLRRKCMAGMESALPEPAASFGMGLLIGQRNTLPEETSRMLLMVGLTHIIAVSGYNLTILLRASKRLLAGHSKRQATLLSLGLIGVFLLFTGSSPSIVRAAIVSMLSIGAAYYGREFKPLVLIVMAVALTAYANPYYVWADAGWYLSFLAFFGVMVLAPMFMQRFPRRLQQSVMAGIALESLCAELMTLPYILFTFGQMSFAALVSNMLVVAFIPFAMLLSLIAGLAGMIAPAIAGWFAWPAGLLLTYMLDVAGLLSRIPHVFVENLSFSLVAVCVMYLAVLFVTVVMHRRLAPNYAIITDRNNPKDEGEIS